MHIFNMFAQTRSLFVKSKRPIFSHNLPLLLSSLKSSQMSNNNNGSIEHSNSNNSGSGANSKSPSLNSVNTANSEPHETGQKEVKSDRLSLLRALFNSDILGGQEKIDAYLLPRTDAHQSEYVSQRDSRVEFISGFTGSNAYAVITRDQALLWTDNRYFIQAASELFDGWTLMKLMPDSVRHDDWLFQNLETGTRIGYDPKLFEFESASALFEKLTNFNIQPVPIARNLVDLIWTDQPLETLNKVIYLTVEECGEEPASKLARVRGELAKRKCDSILLSQLDDIAWLYNLRGSDIPFNPVFFSYAFVTANEKAYLFVDLRKLSPEIAAHLKKNGIDIFDYKDVTGFIKQYHEACKNGPQPEKHKIWIAKGTNYERGSLVDKKYAFLSSSPIQKMKTAKNEVELDGMRRSHIRDSAALVKFLYWLKNELELDHVVDETRAARQINYYREQQDKFVSISFETTSAVDEHAALPHYHPDEESGKKLITKDSVYLLDSGGQYRDGTTDVTRTVCFAEKPDPHFCQMFTLVLKAHLDLATTRFPDGTYGVMLDGVTRVAMWRHGYNYGHGTGHGVGHFLNVHEMPPLIGHRMPNHANFGLKKGTVLTIEPGYYEEGKFGIRIENCYELVEAKGLPSGATNFLAFAPLTLVPIQKDLIVRDQLEQKHIDWLNRYHNACLESVGRYLQEMGMQNEYNFLAEACTPF